jgi:hypothetical protein
MTDETQVMENTSTADAETVVNEEVKETKNFSQEQLDKIVEDRLRKQRSALERKYAGVDPARYNELVEAEEAKKQEEAKSRGEFESILKSTVEKKDNEINSMKQELHKVKVDGAVINAASKFKAINPEQVTQLLKDQVRLGDSGTAEVIDPATGQVRYNDQGEPFEISELVGDFMKANPHFALATPSGSDSKSNLTPNSVEAFDPTKLDMKKPEDRARYAEYRKQMGII